MITPREKLNPHYTEIDTHVDRIRAEQGKILEILTPEITTLIEEEFASSFGMGTKEYSENVLAGNGSVTPYVKMSHLFPASVTVGLQHSGETFNSDSDFFTKAIPVEKSVLNKLKKTGHKVSWSSDYDNSAQQDGGGEY